MNSYNSTRHPFLWGSIGLITGMLLWASFSFYDIRIMLWVMEMPNTSTLSALNSFYPTIIFAKIPELIALYFLQIIINYKLYGGRPDYYLKISPSIQVIIAILLILLEIVFDIKTIMQYFEGIKGIPHNFSTYGFSEFCIRKLSFMISIMPLCLAFCFTSISIARKGGKIPAIVVLFLFDLFIYLITMFINKQLHISYHNETHMYLPSSLIARKITLITLLGMLRIMGISCERIIYIIIASWIISIPISHYYINQISQHLLQY